MKYIVTAQDDGKREIFLFPRAVPHACMAEAIARIRNQSRGEWQRVSRRPVSAGFVRGGVCHGESETLGLKSHPEDTKLLNVPE